MKSSLFSMTAKMASTTLLKVAVPGVSRCAWHTLPSVRAVSLAVPLGQGVPQSLWKLGKLNHVALAVPDLEKATALYRDVLGPRVSATVPLPEHGVYTVCGTGEHKIRASAPSGREKPYCSVDDISAAIVDLKEKKIRLLSPEPRIGAHGKPVMFLHPKDCDGVLV